MVKLRLARGGAKKRPFYWVIAANSDAPRNGRFLEKLGTYNPRIEKDQPGWCVLDAKGIERRLANGAQPTERVAWLLHKTLGHPAPVITQKTKKSAPKQAKKA